MSQNNTDHGQQIISQQKQINGIKSDVSSIAASQESMTTKLDGLSGSILSLGQEIKRLFEMRYDDQVRNKPNYFAWVVGGISVLGASMSFMLMFFKLAIEPISITQQKMYHERMIERQDETREKSVEFNYVVEMNRWRGEIQANVDRLKSDKGE